MKQRHDGGYVMPNNQRIYSTAMGQPPSDVAHALCGWGAWTPPRLLQRPRRGKMWYRRRGARPRLRVMELTPVVPPSNGSSSAYAVEHHRPSISVVDCRTRPSHGTHGGQFATIPPPRGVVGGGGGTAGCEGPPLILTQELILSNHPPQSYQPTQ